MIYLNMILQWKLRGAKNYAEIPVISSQKAKQVYFFYRLDRIFNESLASENEIVFIP